MEIGDFIVTWLEVPGAKYTSSKRFIDTPEIYVDGFVDGLKKAKKHNVYKNPV